MKARMRCTALLIALAIIALPATQASASTKKHPTHYVKVVVVGQAGTTYGFRVNGVDVDVTTDSLGRGESPAVASKAATSIALRAGVAVAIDCEDATVLSVDRFESKVHIRIAGHAVAVVTFHMP